MQWNDMRWVELTNEMNECNEIKWMSGWDVMECNEWMSEWNEINEWINEWKKWMK